MARPVSAEGPPLQLPPRQLVVWCPQWPVVVAGVAPGEAAAVISEHRIVAVSPSAAAEGVRPGARRRDAQARCPSIVLVDDDPDRSARHFEPVVRAVADLVPLVEVSEPGTLVFATRGPSRWCGGDQALAERVRGLVHTALGDLVGLLPAGAGVGVADGRFAAAVAARQSAVRGVPVVVAPGPEATRGLLGSLGIGVLTEVAAVPGPLVDLLGRLGLTTLGALAALDPRDVVARFGLDGAFAHRLATGGDDRAPQSAVPPPELAVEHPFEDPITLTGPVVFTARQLAETLVATLAARGETCTRLLVEAETEHGERTERGWHRSGGLSVAAMVERVRWQLDGWVSQPGGLSAGVVLLRLTPVEVRADTGRQLGFWGEATEADEFAVRAITRVSGLLGPEAVVVAQWQGGRHPADRYCWVPATSADLADPQARREALAPPAHPWPGGLGAPSPARVEPGDVRLEVLDAGGRGVRVDGRGELSGEPASVARERGPSHGVVGWAGPWPVDERWWDLRRRRRRARFQLLTERGEALLASVEGGQWWLEGRYD